MSERAAFYIDGYNYYHGLESLKQPHLKWLNMWALAAHIIPNNQTLVKAVWCTATWTKYPDKMERHRKYVRALKSVGVECLLGFFSYDDVYCHNCRSLWQKPVEKQGDVNLAITLIDDAHRDVFDHAYLLTADADQAATVSLFNKRFKNDKTITSVSPPGVKHSGQILNHTDRKLAITAADLEQCLFDREVMKDGILIETRPHQYDPPAEWVRPVNPVSHQS